VDIGTLIENLNQRELDFAPGNHFAYSNCSYNLAGAVITRLSGIPYERFLEEHLFRPLGMASSYVLGSRADPDFAQGYEPEGSGWRPAPLTTAHPPYASGNLASNPGDMQRWNRSLLNATLLSTASLLEMFAVPALASGAHSRYASGWFVEPGGAIWHGGTLAGYGTANLIVPASGHAITILANTKPGERCKPWELAREIYNAASLGPMLPEFLPPIKTTAPT
jgi:CubicO group peptidase (beta-lactamase class C family)